MNNITINVEFLAGTSIKEAVTEAKSMAIKLDIAYVEFNFNGRSLSIGRRCDIQEAVEGYQDSKNKLLVFN